MIIFLDYHNYIWLSILFSIIVLLVTRANARVLWFLVQRPYRDAEKPTRGRVSADSLQQRFTPAGVDLRGLDFGSGFVRFRLFLQLVLGRCFCNRFGGFVFFQCAGDDVN